MRHIALVLTATTALVGCTTVQPVLPSGLTADSVSLPIKGANGLRGTLRTRTTDGRTAEARYRGYGQSTTWFGVAQKKNFKTRFTTEVAGGVPIEADCRADVQNYTFNQPSVTVQTKPMTYGCTFSRDGADIGAFDLSEIGNGYVLDRAARLTVDSTTLLVTSLHDDATSGVRLAYPIAYAFEDQRGRTVGSVNVAGDRALVVAGGVDADTEAAMRLGAIALSVLSDPATQ